MLVLNFLSIYCNHTLNSLHPLRETIAKKQKNTIFTKTKNMTKIKIYHNSRCSKSRQGLCILEETKQEFEVINYLENPPTSKELKELLKMLNFTPIQLVRKGEKIWKENYKGKEMTDAEILKAMIKNPKLIERPIVVKGNKAVVGRPPENIKALLK